MGAGSSKSARSRANRLITEDGGPELPAWFVARLLPIDAAVADTWGRLQASVERSLPAVDGLLAATALRHHLRLVARNTVDFEIDGLETVNSWVAGA